MDLEKLLSFAAFAKLIGVTDTQVHHYVKGKNGGRPLIERGVVQLKGRKYINPDVAIEELEKNKDVRKSRAQQKNQNNIPTGKELGVSKDGTMGDLTKAEMLLKIKKMDLEVKRRAGELVNKEAVYRALFAYGQEIRTELESMPDRIIDEVLNASDRASARLVLVQAIEDSLLKLSNTPKIS